MPKKLLADKLRLLLCEDIGLGDITTSATIPDNLSVKACVIAKEGGIVAGIEEATILAQTLGVDVRANVVDGATIEEKQILLELFGDPKNILTVERTLLNLLSRMSGIATQTATLSKKLEQANLKTRIAATRKSAPGLLYFDKKAVTIGGGDSHRLHLDDMILIKDNHLSIVGDVEEAIKRAKAFASFSKKIEVEVTSVKDVMKAANAGADIIMLDNFSPKDVRVAVKALKKTGFNHVLVEASGGITEENILEYATAEVDILSIGELTNSVKALDISLEIAKQ